MNIGIKWIVHDPLVKMCLALCNKLNIHIMMVAASYPASPPLNLSLNLSAVFRCNVCAASISSADYNQLI